MTRRRAATTACLVLLVAVATLIGLRPNGAAGQGLGELRDRAGTQRERERSLAASAARLSALIARVERQITVVERRRAAVQAELARDEARLAGIQAELRAERARLARLRARLRVARDALSDRLVVLYKTPDRTLATVALDADGFSDLLERTEFLRRVRDQDQRIVTTVRRARADATGAVQRYKRDEARAAAVVAGMRARRSALAAMAQVAAERRGVLAATRSARLAALAATRASRRGVERRIAKLEAAQARAARAAAAAVAGPGGQGGPGGPWVIPSVVVRCESGGQNLPPNSAGASGYYQIIPGTWRLYGGSGPGAWRASKPEQDRVAARIWAGGRGASHWECAALVGIM